MTVLYRLYKQFVPLIARAYFGKVSVVGEERIHKHDAVLFIANHPSALLDPIVCGSFVDTPLYFLGRADLFKSRLASWFLRKSHMWPIYRDIDGKENLSKNVQTFASCFGSLKAGNSILLYGEGLTDEQFIRRVKRIKKGPARIAFGAEEANSFQLNLKIVPLGINYSNPDVYGADLVIRYGEPIELAGFNQLFAGNPVKAMLEVTRLIEEKLIEEVIHIDDRERSKDTELMLQLDERSAVFTEAEGAVDQMDRWRQSKTVCERINGLNEEEFSELAARTRDFWKQTGTAPGQRLHFIRLLSGKQVSLWKDLGLIILLFPFAVIGAVINLPVFLLIKHLPKLMTPRACFYPGIMIVLSLVLFPLYELLPFMLLKQVTEISWLLYPLFFGIAVFLAHVALRTRQRIIVLWHKWKARKAYRAQKTGKELKTEYLKLHSMAGWSRLAKHE